MENIIIIAILIVIVGGACCYIWKKRKNGIKCIGCPSAGCGSCSGCHGGTHKENDD